MGLVRSWSFVTSWRIGGSSLSYRCPWILWFFIRDLLRDFFLEGWSFEIKNLICAQIASLRISCSDHAAFLVFLFLDISDDDWEFWQTKLIFPVGKVILSSPPTDLFTGGSLVTGGAGDSDAILEDEGAGDDWNSEGTEEVEDIWMTRAGDYWKRVCLSKKTRVPVSLPLFLGTVDRVGQRTSKRRNDSQRTRLRRAKGQFFMMKGSGSMVMWVVVPDLVLVEFVVTFHGSASSGCTALLLLTRDKWCVQLHNEIIWCMDRHHHNAHYPRRGIASCNVGDRS